MTMKHLAEL